jgi:DNA-binding transcriptional ArsR family regulator
MTLPSPIPAELAEMIAARLRVIGDPTRIRILDLLREQELSVGEITERLGTSQQNASKHLGILLQAGILTRHKRGNSSIYSIADRGVYELCEQVCGGLQLQLAELTALVDGGRAHGDAG